MKLTLDTLQVAALRLTVIKSLRSATEAAGGQPNAILNEIPDHVIDSMARNGICFREFDNNPRHLFSVEDIEEAVRMSLRDVPVKTQSSDKIKVGDAVLITEGSAKGHRGVVLGIPGGEGILCCVDVGGVSHLKSPDSLEKI